MNHKDYKRNGQYWDIFDSETSQIWYKDIGNALALQKADWAEQDIADGFANYYRTYAYIQAQIEKPWINEATKPYFSVFPSETYLHTELGFNTHPIYPTKLTSEQYQNIYEPIDDSSEGIGHMKYFDQRVNTLNQQLINQGKTLIIESMKINVQYAYEADKAWRGKTIERAFKTLCQDKLETHHRGHSKLCVRIN